MEQNKMRVGIIGCGGISRMHIAALLAMPNVKITAVCDIRPERLQEAAERTGAKPFADWHELLESGEVETVHICLPHYLHAPVTICALGMGINVLTEKPMATTLEDARAMIAASEAEGAGTLGVIFQNRYNPASQLAKKIIESGEMGAFLGARLDVSWHREAPYYTESGWRGAIATEGAGSLINQSIHTLDLASYLCGPIAKVRGAVFTGLLDGVIEVEDNVSAVAVYENGKSLTIHTTNNYAVDAPILLEMQFEKGALRMLAAKLYRVDADGEELLTDGEKCALPEQTPTAGKGYWGTGHAPQIQDYYRALSAGEHYWLDGREAFPALCLVKSIVLSSDEGRWVTLEKA